MDDEIKTIVQKKMEEILIKQDQIKRAYWLLCAYTIIATMVIIYLLVSKF